MCDSCLKSGYFWQMIGGNGRENHQRDYGCAVDEGSVWQEDRTRYAPPNHSGLMNTWCTGVRNAPGYSSGALITTPEERCPPSHTERAAGANWIAWRHPARQHHEASHSSPGSHGSVWRMPGVSSRWVSLENFEEFSEPLPRGSTSPRPGAGSGQLGGLDVVTWTRNTARGSLPRETASH